jgi:hypothetical protein
LTLQSGTRGLDVPTYADCALGGENTVRGWEFGARRGKNQFINTLEYRYTVLPTRSLKVFGVDFYGGVAIAAVKIRSGREETTRYFGQMVSWVDGQVTLAFGKFSTPPVASHVGSRALDRADIDSIRSCRPGNCDVTPRRRSRRSSTLPREGNPSPTSSTPTGPAATC